MKKVLISIMLSLCCFAAVCSGCVILSSPKLTHPREYYGQREVGDFSVWFSSNDKCNIVGTSEQGNTKKFLIIPAKIEDSPVDLFGDQKLLGIVSPTLKSDVLEKIYFEKAISYNFDSYDNKDCPNLKKVICLNEWKTPMHDFGDCAIYYPRKICEAYSQNNSYAYSLSPANVSYYYNYEDAKNDGYYWVDDCDYGGKIEFVPADPVRKDYTFGGWYKESECINEWDFETDTLPEEKTEIKEAEGAKPVQTTVYQETILYAKWVETKII